MSKDTFASLNKKSGLIEIIDALTGNILAVQRGTIPINQELFATHQLPDGTLVQLQTGIDPGLLAQTTPWPFSQMTIDLICQKIAEGGSLTSICKEPGMPPYYILESWRRKHPLVTDQFNEARRSRAEYLRDLVMKEADGAESNKDPIHATQTRIDAYKWLAGVDDTKYSPKAKIEAHISAPTQIIVSTGINRTARDVTPQEKTLDIVEKEPQTTNDKETKGVNDV